jgi:hypothetical protein
MKNPINDYCIRMFASAKDEYRPYLEKVNFDGTNIYATNLHIIARSKPEYFCKKYGKIEKYPEANKIFDQHVCTEKTTIKTNKVANEFIKHNIFYKYELEECQECDDGTATCHHCDSEHDCQDCNGTGEVESNILTMQSDEKLSLFNRKYRISFFDIILKTALFLNASEIEIENGEDEYSGTYFKIENFEIILMPTK